MQLHRLVRRVAPAALLAAALLAGLPLQAQEPRRSDIQLERPAAQEEFAKLFDAVVTAIHAQFWDKQRLTEVDWQGRAARARADVIAAPTRDEAARRINSLLGDLKTSHTVLLTPDDIDYYVLSDVFGNRKTYDGIGLFTARSGGRDFVDLLLEGFPAHHAGIKVGDEIVSVEDAPYHPIRSFRGRSGEVTVGIRRAEGGPVIPIEVEVVSISPLSAFEEATLDSARIIEQDGRRVGYVHVWASIRDMDNVLTRALGKLGIKRGNIKVENADKPAEAVIVDMRGKIGGHSGMAKRYLEVIDPRGPEIDWRGPGFPAPQTLRGRTAVLIDHHTRSTGELFVHAYKRERQGPLIGTTTAMAVSAGSGFAMPGDTLLHIAVSGIVVDGDVLEGVGVAPDIEVQRPLAYAAGADPVLDAAVRHLARMPARGSAPQDLRGNSQ